MLFIYHNTISGVPHSHIFGGESLLDKTSNGRHPQMEDYTKWMITSNGRQHQMDDNLKWITISNEGSPQMEDLLK